MIQPTTKEQLEVLLINNGIDISEWGGEDFKSLGHLLQEIQRGESVLTSSPFRRTIRFVQVIIRRNGYVLIETGQEMAGGSIRERNRPPAEKIQPGEDVETAAIRGLQEELNLDPSQITLLPDNHEETTREEVSPSYPNLVTCYRKNTVEAIISGLPSTAFTSEEHSLTDPVLRHYWTWVPEVEAVGLF